MREIPTREWPAFLDRLGREHRVEEPRAVRVDETADGGTQALQIDDAAGQLLTLRFRVAVAPGALDGLVPGER